MDGRKVVTSDEIDSAVLDVKDKLLMRLGEKGCHSWVSRHEVLGIITEEYHELVEAVKDKTPWNNSVEHELLDLAVAAILGYINVKFGKTQW